MVAGMVMPLADLRAIYELLFRDGVMVTKKDKRPQCMHPEIPGVANLKVIRTMGSLKSRGYVRETFAWKHAYFYLTNEGIVFLRDYLHLPAEIVPSSLQRIRRPTSTLDVMRRAARVQTVEGPTSYVPKPKAGWESQEAMVERQGYRHKQGPGGEEEATSDRPPMRFRGSYQPRGQSGEPGAPTQTFFRRGQGLRRGEERWAEEPGQGRGGFRSSNLPPESRAVRPPGPAREFKPPTPEIPVSVPLEPKIPQELPVPAAADVEVFPPLPAAPVVVPVVEAEPEVLEAEPEVLEAEPEVLEAEPEVLEVPVRVLEEEPQPKVPVCVVQEVDELMKAVEPVEQVEVKPTVEEEEEEEDDEDDEEDEEDEEEEEVVVTEELVEKASAWLEEEEPKPAAEELTEEAIQPAEVTEEEEIIQAIHVKETEEEPHSASEPEEEEEEEDEDVVVVEEVPEEDSSSDEDSLEEVEIEKDIEILEEPKELVPEAAIEELEPEAESEHVVNTEAIEDEAPIPLTKADTPDPDSDVDLPSPPPSVSDDVTDLSEQHVAPAADHTIHEETPVLDVTPQTSYMPNAFTVTEEVVSPTTVSQSYGVVSDHESFEASFAVPAVPSECPIAALRSSLPQGDWGFLTEDPLDEQEVTKVWPDSLEG